MPSIKAVAKGAKTLASGGNPFDSGLKKLVIQAFDDAACKTPKSGDAKEYKVQFNPSKLDEAVSVEYVEDQVAGTTNGVKKFKHVRSKELKLSLTIDGTGVTGALGSTGKSGTFGLSGDEFDVQAEIDRFKLVCCAYDGSTHDIPYVKILWGPLEFTGRLQSLNISHVMFKSNGFPLRSIIDATFSSAQDLKKQALEQGKNSPDLTHVKTVKVGDTLPLMCQDIYKDSSYYLKVARFNNLIDFRNLEPGTEIIFPPIV